MRLVLVWKCPTLGHQGVRDLHMSTYLWYVMTHVGIHHITSCCDMSWHLSAYIITHHISSWIGRPYSRIRSIFAHPSPKPLKKLWPDFSVFSLQSWTDKRNIYIKKLKIKFGSGKHLWTGKHLWIIVPVTQGGEGMGIWEGQDRKTFRRIFLDNGLTIITKHTEDILECNMTPTEDV